jgi:hypothetical protein
MNTTTNNTVNNNKALLVSSSKEVLSELKLAAQSSVLLAAETVIVSAKIVNLSASTGLQVMGTVHAGVTYLQAKVDERPLAERLQDLLK